MLCLCIYYIFILCYYQAKEMRLSSHTQACGFSPQIYNVITPIVTLFFSSVNEFSKIYLIFFSDNGKVLTE